MVGEPIGVRPHQDEHWLGEAQGTVVVVDPIKTPTGARGHPPPATARHRRRAGVRLMHVIARDGLVDRDYVERHTVGFDELEPLLADCTPEWTSA